MPTPAEELEAYKDLAALGIYILCRVRVECIEDYFINPVVLWAKERLPDLADSPYEKYNEASKLLFNCKLIKPEHKVR